MQDNTFAHHAAAALLAAAACTFTHLIRAKPLHRLRHALGHRCGRPLLLHAVLKSGVVHQKHILPGHLQLRSSAPRRGSAAKGVEWMLLRH